MQLACPDTTMFTPPMFHCIRFPCGGEILCSVVVSASLEYVKYFDKYDSILFIIKTVEKNTHILDDQTQVDSKPAGQPEHASLNQCQLIAANRPKLVLWATQLVVEIRFLCNVIDARALIGPCSHVTSR